MAKPPVEPILPVGQTNYFVRSNKLLQLCEDQAPWKIRVRIDLTRFYCAMWITAAKMKDKGLLYTFKMSDKGLIVKRTLNDTEHIIMSEQELCSFVCKVQKT